MDNHAANTSRDSGGTGSNARGEDASGHNSELAKSTGTGANLSLNTSLLRRSRRFDDPDDDRREGDYMRGGPAPTLPTSLLSEPGTKTRRNRSMTDHRAAEAIGAGTQLDTGNEHNHSLNKGSCERPWLEEHRNRAEEGLRVGAGFGEVHHDMREGRSEDVPDISFTADDGENSRQPK
ncbi:MAG: hypothetical protein Q9217_005048 [Psora testacea]